MTGGMGMMGGYKKASPDAVPGSSYTYQGATTSTRPSYLASFTDEYCGTNVKRITDGTVFGSTDRQYLNYTKNPVEVGGANGTYIAIASRYPPFVLNGPKQTNAFEFVGTGGGTDSDPYPSQIVNNRIFRSTDSRFVYYDLPAGSRVVVNDFSPTYAYVRLTQGEATPSNDENRWAICCKTAASGSSGAWYVVVYQVSTDSILLTYNLNITNSSSTAGACNHVMMSPSGTYVVMSFSATVNGLAEGYHSFRVSDGQYMGQLSNNSNHGDVLYAEDGVTELWIGQNDAGDLIYRRIDCSQAAQVIVTEWLQKAGFEMWATSRCLDRPGYAYVGSTQFSNIDGTTFPATAFDDIVFAVRVADGTVEPWVRGYAGGAESGSIERYFVPSRDGKRLYVTLPNPLRQVNPARATQQETYVVTYQPSGT
jgi:hypothetical protein